MKRVFIALSILLMLAAARLGAENANPLGALDFLTGSCWKGTFPDGKTTDTHCFEWLFGDKFVRDRHLTEGGDTPYAGETLYAWDPKEKIVRYTYWNSSGGVSTGTILVDRDGTLRFPESYVSKGRTLEMNNVWRKTGTDEYTVVVTQKNEGKWVEAWRMTLRRKD